MSLITINVSANIAAITELLNAVLDRSDTTMATVQQIRDAARAEAAEVKTKIDALVAEVEALKAQVAAGGTITEAQLDVVLEDVQNIFTSGGAVPPVNPI